MRKREVVLLNKETSKTAVYSTVKELAQNNDKDAIGISLHSLWNALSKSGGAYENAKCRIYLF